MVGTCRTCLLLLLLACMDAVFLVEQPESSLLFHYGRLKQTARLLKAAGVKATDFDNYSA